MPTTVVEVSSLVEGHIVGGSKPPVLPDPKDLMPLVSMGTFTHVHIPTNRCNNIHIVKNAILKK